MEYWRKLQAAIPAYRMYRIRTDREIPIVRLRRRDADAESAGEPAEKTATWEQRSLAS